MKSYKIERYNYREATLFKKNEKREKKKGKEGRGRVMALFQAQ